jgi:hypothetical protein
MGLQKRMAHVVALVVIGVCALEAPAFAQDCPELVGRVPAPVYAVAVSGDYAYLGGDHGFFIADVLAPSAPRVVGDVNLWSPARDVALSGSYAYVVGTQGLHVIDVSTPSAPVEVGLLYEGGDAVAVSSGYAYVASRHGGLHVIDVSTPSFPERVGYVQMPGGAFDVAVSGDYAYVADDYGVYVIDVSTPLAPQIVHEIALLGGAQAIAVVGDYAYAAGNGLHVIDVSAPSEPLRVGDVDTFDGAADVAVSGGYAYVALGWLHDEGGLRIIDVRAPSAPVEVGVVDTPAERVAASGGYAYVANGNLHVIDVRTPSAPDGAGFLGTVEANGVAVSGGYAFVAAGRARHHQEGLRVIDVSAPSAPVEVGFVDIPGGDSFGVAVSAGHAFVTWSTHYGNYLSVIDVSTPSAPVRVGSVQVPCPADDVAVSGNYAYVACGLGPGNTEASLRIIDISTPSAPVEAAFIDIPGWDSSVAVSGDHAYVAWAGWDADEGGLSVIDVSTPSAPVQVGFLDTPGGAFDVAVSGDHAYVAWAGWDADEGGLSVIDVRTPSAPVQVGFLDTLGGASDVAVSRSYAYVTLNDWSQGDVGGLWVIDVSVALWPVEVGIYGTVSPGRYSGIAISDGFVFLSGDSGGLYIFNECLRPAPDARECFIPAAAAAAGAQGAFFHTDVEINNTGTEEAQLTFQWLPRGEDTSTPTESEPIALAPGQSLRYENVLTELFGLEPDSLGALKMVASTESVIGMSRTYNIPAGKTAGTFGQGLPAIRATEMIQGVEPQRIIFLSENDDSRANVGCVNGSSELVTINIGLSNAEGEPLETKTMDLGPYSNNQINRVFQDYAPVNGYVDVWADSDEALYYCYGSMLDNLTSDPTTILPQVPADDVTFIPAAALAAGLEGSFFQTDLDLNNVGSTDLTYELLWLPRGADNSDAVHSDTFSLAPGAGVRYANVLDEVFGLEPDQVGALAVEASGIDLLAMSRTYNLPSAKVAGTFGQELPGIPADKMIPTGVRKRIIFMSENDDVRANVGCVNGAGIEVAVQIELYDSDGVKLETKYMMLPPYSNRQINGIFQDYAPINGYVDVRTYTPDALIYCYGSVLDNLTSDPTTVLPQ